METGKRLKEIRKDLNLTQTEFGDAIGVKKSMVAQAETGRAKMSERVLKYACNYYGVNYEWLTTGTGEKYKPKTQNQELAEFLTDIMETQTDNVKKRFILALSKLSENEWETLADILEKIKNAE